MTRICGLFLLLGGLAFSWSGCSPGMFTGSPEDAEVLAGRGSRQAHEACSELDLSRREFDSDSFNKTLNCLNSGGALEDLARFTRTLDAVEMNAVVSIANGLLGLAPDLSPAAFFDLLEDSLVVANETLRHSDLRSGIDFLRKERTSTGQSFFLKPFDLAKAFELSDAESDDLIQRLLGWMDDGRLNRFLGSASFFITREVESDEVGFVQARGPVLRPLLDAASLLLEEKISMEFRRSLNEGARAFKKDEFPELLRFLEAVTDAKPEPSLTEPLLGTPLSQVTQWVRVEECVSGSGAQRARALQVIDEYQSAVTTWDLKGGVPRRSWEFAEMRSALEPLLAKISDPAQSAPGFPLWQALLQTLHLEPHYMASWLKDRAADDRLILYFYPGETVPRVRLVNTLDRLELVLINSDFIYNFLGLYPGNNAHEFMANVALAWGDEPPSSWPAEVHRLYPNPKPGKSWPQTLRQAYEEMVKKQSDSQSFVGKPSWRRCEDEEDSVRAPKGSSGGSSGLVPFDVKARLFNVKQLMGVIEENLPDSGTPSAGGMKMIRDLLYVVYEATPAQNRGATSGEKNNFSALIQITKLGLFHQVGRQLRRDDPNSLEEDKELVDFFKTTLTASEQPEFEELLDFLVLSKGDHRLFWRVMEQVFDALSRSSEETAWMKQLAFYGIVCLNSYGWIPPFLKTANKLLRENEDFFVEQTHFLDNLLLSRKASSLVRSLYEQEDGPGKILLSDQGREWLTHPRFVFDLVKILKAIDQNQKIKDSLSLFKSRMEIVVDASDYKALRLGELLKDANHFFETPVQTGVPGEVGLPARLRAFLADRMVTQGNLDDGVGIGDVSIAINADALSDLEEILRLYAKHPDTVYALLENFTRHLDNGDFRGLQDILRRSLKPK